VAHRRCRCHLSTHSDAWQSDAERLCDAPARRRRADGARLGRHSASIRYLSPTMPATAGVRCSRTFTLIASPGVTRATCQVAVDLDSRVAAKDRPAQPLPISLTCSSSRRTTSSSRPGKVELQHAVDFLVDWRERLMLAAVLRSNEQHGAAALRLARSRQDVLCRLVSGRSQRAVLLVSRPRTRAACSCMCAISRGADFGTVFGSDSIGLQYAQSILHRCRSRTARSSSARCAACRASTLPTRSACRTTHLTRASSR
jgi:hypothetical protein